MKLFLHNIKYRLQILLHKFGWHISKYTPIKAEEDTYQIQKLLLSHTNVDTIFDVGAWIGKTAQSYSSVFPSASIHVFEPFPESFQKLDANIKGASGNFVLNQLAVSSDNGEKNLYSNKVETTNSLLPSKDTNSNHDFYRDTINTVRVKTTTLDNYCAAHNIDKINILKVDTQGGELEVFKGATGLLDRKAIDLIYCEVSFVAMYENSPLFNDIMAFMQDHGYRFYALYGAVKNEHGQLAWADAIFYSDEVDHQVKTGNPANSGT